MFNLDPKKMNAVMKQMGISQEDLEATRVIIEKGDERIIIENPSVTKVKMNGQETFQVSGQVREELENSGNLKEDIETVMEKTGCSKEEAKEILEETGDLAEAIMRLSK